MNKKELVSKVMKSTGQTQAVTREVIDSMLEEITTCLEHGETVKLVGFGTFYTKKRAKRNGVSPKDKTQKIVIPAKTVPGVRFGKTLRDKVDKK